MTPEQWNILEDELHTYSYIELFADDHKITLTKEIPKQGMISFCVFVNGRFKGTWMDKDSPYNKYLFAKKTKIWGVFKSRTNFNIELKKNPRFVKELCKRHEIPKVLINYTPFYSSFRTFKNTIESNCTIIEPFENDHLSKCKPLID